MNVAASLAKNAIGPAISSGRPTRPSGIVANTFARPASSDSASALMSVATHPGATQLTRMPNAASSVAKLFVTLMAAPLEDDAARAPRLHPPNGGARDAHVAAQVRVEGRVVLFGRHRVDGRLLPDTVVEHDGVDRAQRGFDVGDEALPLVPRRERSLKGPRHASRGDDLSHHPVGRGSVVVVVHGDLGAERREERRGRGADAPARARDERPAPREIDHADLAAGSKLVSDAPHAQRSGTLAL